MYILELQGAGMAFQFLGLFGVNKKMLIDKAGIIIFGVHSFAHLTFRKETQRSFLCGLDEFSHQFH